MTVKSWNEKNIILKSITADRYELKITIIRGFKSTVTKQINDIRNTPGHPVWQRSYYEHVIRNEKSYNRISEYIRYNPEKWLQDKYYVD